MKSIIKASLAMILLLQSLSVNAEENKKRELATVKFETSIDCQNCVNTIMKNIPFEKGVKDIKCNLATKEVTIWYQKDKTSPEILRRAIEKLGYTAREAKPKS